MSSMTASDSDAERRAEVLPGPVQRGVLVNRARSLLIGGIIGAHLLALPVIFVCGVVDGPRGMLSAALGAALALLFYTIGQAVQIRFAGARAMTLFAASLASFGFRAALLGAVLVGWLSLSPQAQARLTPMALLAGILAGVVGWLLGLARAYSKLRILAFDDPEPSEPGSSSAGEVKAR